MGIQSFIKSVCVQTAIYWGNPVPNGKGGYTFDDPVSIKVRWDDVNELIRDNNGVDFLSVAQVLVTQDLSNGGYLWLGGLEFLYDVNGELLHDVNGEVLIVGSPFSDDVILSNPVSVPDAYMIGKFDKSPEFRSTTNFVRIAHLGWQTKGK